MNDVATTETTAVAAPEATAAQAAPAPASGFDWAQHVNDPETLGYVQNKGWKGPGDVLGSYRNLEKLTGVPADKIVKLPTDDNAEAWNEVYTKLGRPESADKYTLPLPQGDDGAFAKEAAAWFHEAGLSNSQAAKVAEKWNEHMTKMLSSEAEVSGQKHQAEINSLKAEWGSNYEANATLVDRAASTFGLNEQQLGALKSALGPAGAMKMLHSIGSKIAVEDNGLIGHNQGSAFGAVTPEQAMAKIAANRSDRTFIERFTSSDPKMRGEARAEMDRLHRIAYPGA